MAAGSGWRSSLFISILPQRRLGAVIHAHHLTQGVQHFHQLALGFHDPVDVLVGHRDLVDHVGVLAAFDVGGGAAWSATLKTFFALVRLMVRPAPWLHEQNASWLPRPRTMKLFAPIEPGMMPSWPFCADTAPLR